MKQKTAKEKPLLVESDILQYLKIRQLIEHRAIYVVDALLYRDKESVIFQDLSWSDRVESVDLVSVANEISWMRDKQVTTLRMFLKVKVHDNSGSESVWVDCSLLYYTSPDHLMDLVDDYVKRIAAPTIERRKRNELIHMIRLMRKFGPEVEHVLHPPKNGCPCMACNLGIVP